MHIGVDMRLPWYDSPTAQRDNFTPGLQGCHIVAAAKKNHSGITNNNLRNEACFLTSQKILPHKMSIRPNYLLQNTLQPNKTIEGVLSTPSLWATWGLEPHIGIQSLYYDIPFLCHITLPSSGQPQMPKQPKMYYSYANPPF